MVSNNDYHKDHKKPYRICSICKTLVIDLRRTPCKRDIIVTEDLSYKRHICSGAERIIHEENTVKARRHIEHVITSRYNL